MAVFLGIAVVSLLTLTNEFHEFGLGQRSHTLFTAQLKRLILTRRKRKRNRHSDEQDGFAKLCHGNLQFNRLQFKINQYALEYALRYALRVKICCSVHAHCCFIFIALLTGF
ncbi:MAG: hypothetical protein DCF15_14285 [Phormidesmis priestleyi]|uniref:Uncharacterized protein n=1 Tax=Phormidesmis priestleyi TaxID=268141 RepID=A0A2W4X8H7_9CYAN|nr:MAG: hypothetical protein DCF15_14285 [Phormidesmis priestleyi]